MTVVVTWREVEGFGRYSSLGLIHFIDQLNEKDNTEIKFKGHLFVLGKLAWEIHSSVYCENK